MKLVLQLPHGIMGFHAGCFTFLQQELGIICGSSAHTQHKPMPSTSGDELQRPQR